MSLTMTATRRPSRLFRMWFMSVVFPAATEPPQARRHRKASSFAHSVVQ
jgi:hypothetical protein